MKFLMMVKADEKYRAEGPPKALLDAMGEFVQASFASGRVVDTGGLKPSAAATRLRIEKGKLTVVDGPFTEAKEVVGGWAIVKVSSRAEALENARQFMELHQKNWPGWEGTSEVYEMEEYG
ncbi:MAG: YciI family protein [bacterium]